MVRVSPTLLSSQVQLHHAVLDQIYKATPHVIIAAATVRPQLSQRPPRHARGHGQSERAGD